ncbi:hypothetical protein [Streptomyces sp.]|uniref:hypothetical protein n=1 Tax=Streptomyces sp. TaxID=1931 RepID=UPI002D796086|nr:hypothetical protein [Streptomyces sp.]HET6358905.1 hypothetical protein [Streptomyces sp.]
MIAFNERLDVGFGGPSTAGAPQVPHGWPGCLPPPGSLRFVPSAKAWLFDLAPGRWRLEPVLNRHPELLARMVRNHLRAGIAAMRLNRESVEEGLLGYLPPGSVQDAVAMCAQEGERAVALLEQVKIVEKALRPLARSSRRAKARSTF